jgi:hypothetical protein
MPSLVLIIPVLQSLLGKRRPEPRMTVASFESAGQTERGKNSELRVTQEKSAKELEKLRLSWWCRMRDYLWGGEDEESRGEYIPNFRFVQRLPLLD